MKSFSALILAVATGASLANAAALGDTFASKKRQISTDGRCGTGFGTVCEDDECCSVAGWCGNGYDYCSAPACQIDYGPACDANVRPTGADTANIPRPKLGSIPYGEAIYHCEKYGEIALSYDDGPWDYTEHLLDLLDEYDTVATFYITGRNLGKGAINDPTTPWPALIKRMAATGHQIASHTWSHQRLTTLSEEKFMNQMHYNEIAFGDLLGYFPTYMRPPYSASNATTDAWLGDLGYHITYFNLDTEGYLNDDATLIQNSKDIWDAAVEGQNPKTTKWLDIEHDPVYQSVYNLTEYFLKSIKANGFKAVTVGDCLGDDKAYWYRYLDGSTPTPSTTVTKTSTSTNTATFPATTNGRCGANQGNQACFEEPDATCCSPAGWCGATSEYCGTGCQPLYGNCDGSSSSSSSSTSASTTTGTAAQPSTTDGRCGTGHGDQTCKYETDGETCCSPAGWCGSTSAHCGTGCQPLFGICSSVAASSSSTSKATSTTSSGLPATTNGRCGSSFGMTCLHEPGATCCSKAGWCGSTSAYCGTGCQSGFGTCGSSN